MSSEKDARIAELEAQLEEAKQIVAEDESFGALVETIFYAPLRAAEADLRLCKQELASEREARQKAEALIAHATAFQFGGKPQNMACRIEDLPIRVEARDQRDGTRKWAVMQGGNCLRHDGQWELEMQPSSRSDEFLKMARWTFAEALDAAREASHE